MLLNYETLDKPYTEAEVMERMKVIEAETGCSGWIEGFVLISIETLINSDREMFLDYITEALVSEGSLTEIDYMVWPCTGEDNRIILKVGGFYQSFKKDLNEGER